MNRNKKVYIISILIALGTGVLSGFLSRSGMKDYAALVKPPLAPPGWVFPVVWTILFILMGVGAAIVYTTRSSSQGKALRIYALQLVVNFFWSILFFRFGWRLPAFFWLLILIVLVAAMIRQFYKVSPLAAVLQIPYFLWLCFAAYLNLAIWWLNL